MRGGKRSTDVLKVFRTGVKMVVWQSRVRQGCRKLGGRRGHTPNQRFWQVSNHILIKGKIMLLPYYLRPTPGLSNCILRPCCLSVCPSVIECIQQEQKTFARATPPPLQSCLGQGCRTVWGHGKRPHQVLTEFDLCTQMTPMVLDFDPPNFETFRRACHGKAEFHQLLGDTWARI